MIDALGESHLLGRADDKVRGTISECGRKRFTRPSIQRTALLGRAIARELPEKCEPAGTAVPCPGADGFIRGVGRLVSGLKTGSGAVECLGLAQAGNRPGWVSVISRMEPRQGLRSLAPASLPLEEEDVQAAQQGEVLRQTRAAHTTLVLILGDIASIVLSVLDGPIAPRFAQQPLGWSLVGVEAGDSELSRLSDLRYLAPANILDRGVDAEELRSASESDALRVGRAGCDAPMLNPAVFLADRAGLRGEARSGGAAGPLRTRSAGCLLIERCIRRRCPG